MLAANGTAVVGESNEKRLEVGVGDGDERTVLLADFPIDEKVVLRRAFL